MLCVYKKRNFNTERIPEPLVLLDRIVHHVCGLIGHARAGVAIRVVGTLVGLRRAGKKAVGCATKRTSSDEGTKEEERSEHKVLDARQLEPERGSQPGQAADSLAKVLDLRKSGIYVVDDRSNTRLRLCEAKRSAAARVCARLREVKCIAAALRCLRLRLLLRRRGAVKQERLLKGPAGSFDVVLRQRAAPQGRVRWQTYSRTQ